MLKKKDVDYFDAKDVDKMLKFLGVLLTKSEIDLMLWVNSNSYCRKLMKIQMAKLVGQNF